MKDQTTRLRVLAAGIFSLLLVLGVARFAYTPLLPLMQHQAGLGIDAGAWLAAINYAGYLSGAVIASLIGDVVLKDRLYRLGLVLAVLSTAVMGLSNGFALWALSRFVGGLASAAGMLLGTGLVFNWLVRNDHRAELGIHFAGIGLGIAGCAAAVEIMSRWLGWRGQWFAFAAIGAVLLVPAWRWLPPADRSAVSRAGQALQDRAPGPLFMVIFMAAYFCAGVGFVVSTTFIVQIVDSLPGLSGHGRYVFMVIGLAAVPSCIVWDLVARRCGQINALIAASALQIAGILLPVWPGGLVCAFAGAMLFGGTFVGLVGLVLTMAGRYYPTSPAKMMGKMTLSYGSAQIIAPWITGWLAVHLGSYAGGLYMAAGVMAVGTLLLLVLRGLEQLPANRATAPA
jgi:predicted MFS family arabinose efflux permease